MEAKEPKSSGGAAVAAIIVLALILLPVVYVAALGPVIWLIVVGI